MEFRVYDKASAPEESRAVMEQAEQALGMIPNVLGVLAESPFALSSYMTMTGLLEKSGFSPQEQQLAIVAISAENGCRYCVAAHSGMAKQMGAPDEAIEALRAGKPIPDAKLEALRTFAEQLREKRGWVSDDEIQAFIDAGYKKQHVLDLIGIVALKTITNYTNHIADTPLDEAFAPMKWEGK